MKHTALSRSPRWILAASLALQCFVGESKAATSPESKMCDDLFSAACLDEKGKNRFDGKYKAVAAALSDDIAAARDASAKKLGYASFNDGLKARLRENGLPLSEPVSPDTMRALTKTATSDDMGSSGAENSPFTDVAKCNALSSEVVGKSYYGQKDIAVLKSAQAKIEAFKDQLKEDSIKLYSKDISNFYASSLQSSCSSMRFVDKSAAKSKATGSDSAAASPDPNAALRKICENMPSLKRQAISLFRLEGTPGYAAAAEKFVRDNYPPRVNYGGAYSSAITYPAGMTPPPKTEADLLQEKISAASSNLPSCSDYSTLVEATASKVFEDYAREVNLMKPTVDGVIGSIYNSKTKAMATEVFKSAKADVQAIVGEFVRDPAKKTAIVDGYETLTLKWMDPPADEAYARDAKGNLSLSDEAGGAGSMFEGSFRSIFEDPTLSHFTTLNADYMPEIKVGAQKSAERVNMMPVMIKLAEQNPGEFLSTLSHEVAHKIGPQMSRMNGFDLSPEYSDLVKCLKGPSSIRLQKDQEDEAVADYISSEVMARQLAKFPLEKRRSMLMSGMQTLCVAESVNQSVSCKANHPESSLRISGIYGANANLRSVVGCKGAAPGFVSCSVKDISSPKEGVQNRLSSPSSGTSGSGAVQ